MELVGAVPCCGDWASDHSLTTGSVCCSGNVGQRQNAERGGAGPAQQNV
jgi:hypothetical protein